MKKYFIFTLGAIVFLSSAPPVFAHDLLPKQVVQYLAEHPHATPEEIQTYAQTLDPATAAKFTNTKDVVETLRNQRTNLLDNSFDFLKLGVGHILSGPDHILFVLSMLLVFATITELLQLTSTFTIAHSITLLLAGSGILVLSPRITEPLIAFSIAYMAIFTVFVAKSDTPRALRNKIATVFFFGLFHGLGFAGLLREIAIPNDKFLSSLLSFNIGIEVGQLIIVFCAVPCIFFARNKSWYPKVIQVLASAISLVALFWVLQRLLTP